MPEVCAFGCWGTSTVLLAGAGYDGSAMGQLALGFRSLAIRTAVFFVMAALLAWALGGTLWERTIDRTTDAARVGDAAYYWRVSLSGNEAHPVRWRLMRRIGDNSEQPVEDMEFVDVAGPMAVGNDLYFGGKMASEGPQSPLNRDWGPIAPRSATSDGQWTIRMIAHPSSSSVEREWPMPDRLAVEQQIARLRSGLPIQDEAAILRQRSIVLDPSRADEASDD